MLPCKDRLHGRVSWLWIAALTVPAGMSAFVEKCSGTALVFTLRKFLQDPQAIAGLTSLNILFGLLAAPVVAWYSDRIDPRLGKRKIFMIPGLSLVGLCLVLLPNLTHVWLVVLVVVVYQFSMDVGFTGVWRPLYVDQVPDKQRGRGMVMNRYMAITMRMVFMLGLIGQFDKQFGAGPIKGKARQGLNHVQALGLSGEQMIYYAGAGMVFLTVVFLLCCVREPHNNELRIGRSRFCWRTYFASIFGEPQLRPLYWLVFASTLMSLKLGPFHVLLITEQFGFSKQMMGNIHTVSMVLNMVLILPVGALLVDRINRWRLFWICVIGSTLQPVTFWWVVHTSWGTSHISPGLVIGFHIIDAAFDHLGLIVLWPLLFERVSAKKRGTAQAGFLIVSGAISFIMMNLMGFWVKYWPTSSMAEGAYNYMSGYVLVFIVGVAACVVTWKSRLLILQSPD